MPSNSTSSATTALKSKTKRSPAQIEASRRNGAKSRGPVSAAGKARAAQNALRHGLAAEGTTILLCHEAPSAFEQLSLAYYTQFQPSNPVEIDLVDEMIAARCNRCTNSAPRRPAKPASPSPSCPTPSPRSC